MWLILANGCARTAPNFTKEFQQHDLYIYACNLPPQRHEGFDLIDCVVSDGDVLCYYVGEYEGRRCVGIATAKCHGTYNVAWAGCEGTLTK